MSDWVSSTGGDVEVTDSGIWFDLKDARLDKIETTLAKITAILSEAGFTEVTND